MGICIDPCSCAIADPTLSTLPLFLFLTASPASPAC
jgi:hypothetical protein